MERLLQDARFAVRMWIKSPKIILLAVFTLAVGVGANTAIFSIINGVLISPLSFEDPDRLVILHGVNPQKGLTKSEITPADFSDFKSQSESFERLAALRFRDFTLTGLGEPELLPGGMVSAEFFSLLGVTPLHGRTFRPDEDQIGKHQVVIISYGLWKRRFGSNEGIVEQTLTLNGETYSVIGVLAPGFNFPTSSEQTRTTDLWVPLALTAQESANRRNHVLLSVGRLKPGVTIQQAQAEMSTIASRLEERYPESNSAWGVTAFSITEKLVGDARSLLLILLGSVGFVLLIACANVANLLLAKALARQKEIAIRTALGATRRRLIRQLLTESILLSICSAIIGIFLAWRGIEILSRINPDYIPRMDEIGIDGRVLGFTLIISLLTGIIFGITPAIQASKPNLNESLKEGGRYSSGEAGRSRFRTSLVIGEVALSVVLLIGAGLLIKSFLVLIKVNPGINPENVVAMEIALPRSKYREPARQAAFFQQLIKQTEALPGVESVGATNHLPMAGTNSSFSFLVEGRPLPASGEALPTANWRSVTPDYFSTMGIPMRGRTFDDRDKADAPLVAIISESMARMFWPNEDPIGKQIRLGGPGDPEAVLASIIGIAGDVKHWGLEEEAKQQMYLSHLQQPPSRMNVVVRTSSDPRGIISSLRSQVWSLDGDQPITSVRLMEDVVAESVSRRRFTTILIAILAGLALVLTTVGIYGVISYLVTQRMHEIGIRMALGARPLDILKLVLGHGLTLILAGVVIGLIAAFGLTRFISSLLHGINQTDSATFFLTPLVLILVAMLATYLPARRASRMDPMIAVRHE